MNLNLGPEIKRNVNVSIKGKGKANAYRVIQGPGIGTISWKKLELLKPQFAKMLKKKPDEIMIGGGGNLGRYVAYFNEGIKEAVYKYQVYHNTYSSVINEVEKWLVSLPYDYDEDELTNAYLDAFFKPKPGKTKRDTISLYTKNGRLARKAANIQVYNTGNKFELNMYMN